MRKKKIEIKKIKNIFSNQKGMALLTTLIFVFILVTFAVALLTMTSNDTKLSALQRDSTKAFYIAEAGIEKTLYNLKKDYESSKNWDDGDINGYTLENTSGFRKIYYITDPPGYDVPFGGGTYTVSLNIISSNNVTIKSKGICIKPIRYVQVNARVGVLSIWDNAIFAGSGASGRVINGNVNIRGSVHILGEGLSPTDFAIDMGGGALIILVSWNMLNDFRLDYHNLPVPGTLIHKELHSNPEDTFKVFKYKYTFKDKSGIKHRGISYWTKGSPGVGQDVEVQYLPENPKINRITGSRNSELGWFVLIFCILPLIGPGIMIFSLFPRAKKLRLLRYGECANGIITKIIDSQWRTGKHIKIFKVKVEFKDLLGKKWKTTFEIKGRGVLSLKEKMKNVDPIPLLYNSKNPKQVFIAT